MMKLRHLIVPFLMLTLLTACPAEEEEANNDAKYQVVPSAEMVSIDVPDDASTGGLIGETAEFYQFTKGVSGGVNIHVGILLVTLKAITLLPASESGEDYRIWGPSEPKGLEMNAWRLVVKEVGENRFSFSLEGRNKASTSDDDWLPTIVGEVTPGETAETSLGSMELLFDNSMALEADICNTGIIKVDWDNTGDDRLVDVHWEDWANSCKNEAIESAHYAYSQNKDASGLFEFQTFGNVHIDAAKDQDESLRIRSRWMGDGTGRSDVFLSGDDIAADLEAAGLSATEVQVSQCWNSLFSSVYETTSPAELQDFLFPEAGDVNECAFTVAELPQL